MRSCTEDRTPFLHGPAVKLTGNARFVDMALPTPSGLSATRRTVGFFKASFDDYSCEVRATSTGQARLSCNWSSATLDQSPSSSALKQSMPQALSTDFC
jgi:hypothetical protein